MKLRINEEKISQIPPEGHVYYRGIQQGFGLVGEKNALASRKCGWQQTIDFVHHLPCVKGYAQIL